MEPAPHSRKPRTSIDPEIRRFMESILAGFSGFSPNKDTLFTETRELAEKLRLPWTKGGPVMAETREQLVSRQGHDVRIRIYRPTSDDSQAALIYIHGGGWTTFSLDTHDRIMREYAARAGVAVVGIDYSLSPEVKFPCALEEINCVIKWLVESGDEYGIDSSRLAIGGDSAGANLSVASCLKLRDEGLGKVIRAMILNYGVYDSNFERASYKLYGGEGEMLTTDEMKGFWQNYTRNEQDMNHPLTCPLHADLSDMPAALMVIADIDPLYDENMAMAKALHNAGASVQATAYPGTVHSFLEAVSVSRLSEQAFADTARWLKTII